MYNLIVSGDRENFRGQPFDLEISRCISSSEYTDADLADRYNPLTDAHLSELLSFPALLAYESGVKEPATVARLTRLRVRRGVARIEYEAVVGVPPIAPDVLEEASWELDLGKNELYRTHWALKSPNLDEALIEANVLPEDVAARIAGRTSQEEGDRVATETLITPSVFRVPSEPRDAQLVSVMMPFDQGFLPVWHAIRLAGAQVGLICMRADGVWDDSVLVQDVFSLLWKSAVVVVDFTGRNPNVMYETGIAHTLGRAVVPLAQSGDDVPFDLQHHRYLHYSVDAPGLAELETNLAKRLARLQARGAI